MNSITPQIYNFNGASLPKKQIVNSANAQATIENVLSSPMGATAAITTLAGVFCGIANLAKGKINTNDIPRNIKLSEAPSAGICIFDYDKNSVGAVAYQELAKEVLSRNG